MRQGRANKVERQIVQDGYKTDHDVGPDELNVGLLETVLRIKEERKLHTTEMGMLWWARKKTRSDHARNVDI